MRGEMFIYTKMHLSLTHFLQHRWLEMIILY